MITRTARSLLRLNNNIVFGFCLNKAHLNPLKHTTMNHYPHNMYVDLYDFGEYPEVIAPASIPARTYQPIVVATTVDILNAKYVPLFLISRELLWLLMISTPNSINHGIDSSKKTSKLKKVCSKFCLQFWINWPLTSLSEKADGLGSRNKEKDSVLQPHISRFILQKQSVNSSMPTMVWSKSSFWPHLWVWALTFLKLQLHWKSITFKKWPIVYMKELRNLTTSKVRTTISSTKLLD